MAESHTGPRRHNGAATKPALPARMGCAAILIAISAITGCTRAASTGPHAAVLSRDSLRETNLQFRTDRTPVLAPGTECNAFTPQVHTVADVPQDIRATSMVPGHGCWADAPHGNVVAVMTTATSFGDFWRRDYPDDDGSGITATMVDKNAQLFERFLIDDRYYAVRVGSQWTAGLDSGMTKTACMLVVDTGSAQPLLINLTQQVRTTDPAAQTITQQCTLAASVARKVLDQQDPGGGSRTS